MDLEDIVKKQRIFYERNVTKSVKFRKQALLNLKIVIDAYQEKLMEAVKRDFERCYEETYLAEISIVKRELDYFIKNVTKLSKIKKVKTKLSKISSKGYIIPEPYGICLISSPWNYPIHLSFVPLIASVAAGNCIILVLDEKTLHVNRVIKEMLAKVFDDEYIYVITDGNMEKVIDIVSSKVDYIFYTGNSNSGKKLMRFAADKLTPVTLVLGGKNPVLISDEVNLEMAAKSIVWGKFMNAGQTHIAPDYLLVTKETKEKLIPLLKKYIDKMYYKNEVICDNYAKIIDENSINRLSELINKENILLGGQIDRQDKVIEPTVIKVNSLEDKIMQEEIFGPILALVEVNSMDDAINFVSLREKPLTIYLFSEDKNVINKVINNTSSGNICINDTMVQIAENNLPFGGVGSSGIGSYHGKKSFETFTHQKSVLKRNLSSDNKLRYPPYNKNVLKKLK